MEGIISKSREDKTFENVFKETVFNVFFFKISYFKIYAYLTNYEIEFLLPW